MFLGDRRLSMLSVSEMVDVLDFDFDMEDGEKVANHFYSTRLFFFFVFNLICCSEIKTKFYRLPTTLTQRAMLCTSSS